METREAASKHVAPTPDRTRHGLLFASLLVLATAIALMLADSWPALLYGLLAMTAGGLVTLVPRHRERIPASQRKLHEDQRQTLALLRDHKRQEEELLRSRAKLRELTAHRERIREAERAHIARELHDDLGQYLTALRMDAKLLEMRYGDGDPELRERLGEMRSSIDHIIAGTRNVIARLRPAALDLGIASATEWLVADYQERTGILCHLRLQLDERQLDDEQATTLFRILQESLTNVARHARARQAWIQLESVEEQVRLEVRDDGRGFDQAIVREKKTFGLMGIRERALIYGGSANIRTEEGIGTTLEILLPLHSGTAA